MACEKVASDFGVFRILTEYFLPLTIDWVGILLKACVNVGNDLELSGVGSSFSDTDQDQLW